MQTLAKAWLVPSRAARAGSRISRNCAASGALGVGANIEQETEQALQAWLRRPFTIAYIATIPPSFTVAQYNQISLDSLKKKLAQFPSGMKFVLTLSSPTPSPAEQKVREEIFQFAQKNGITVMCAGES
jgi:hypothetical protein